MSAPTPPEDLPGYDTLRWPNDVLAVWIEGTDGAKDELRETWPDLAAALDREAVQVLEHGDRPRWLTPPERVRPVPWQTSEEG